MEKTVYITTLPDNVQWRIRQLVDAHLYYNAGLRGEELQDAVSDAMDSRLIDLGELINVDAVVEWMERI